jgi:hypothetical protein
MRTLFWPSSGSNDTTQSLGDSQKEKQRPQPLVAATLIHGYSWNCSFGAARRRMQEGSTGGGVASWYFNVKFIGRRKCTHGGR